MRKWGNWSKWNNIGINWKSVLKYGVLVAFVMGKCEK
jgi:hypothetical protein